MQKIRMRRIEFPVAFNASGARGFFGEGDEYWFHRFFRFIGLIWLWTTFVAKTTTYKANKGNMPLNTDDYSPAGLVPDCIYLRHAWRGRLLNAVGLSGPGFEALLGTRKWQKRREPFFLSFMPIAATAWQRALEFRFFRAALYGALPNFAAPFGLEINVSCPNTGHAAQDLVRELRDWISILKADHALDGIPVLIKLGPTTPVQIVVDLESEDRIDGWTVFNTARWDDLPSLGIDRKKIFGTDESPLPRSYGGGGYSGPEMRRHVTAWIRKARELGVTKKIIAQNGIRAPWHAIEMIEAGADGIGIGSMAICRPFSVLPTVLLAHWAARRRQRKLADARLERLTITRPDDFHVHLRFGDMLRLVLWATASVFKRFLVMPNKPAIRNAKDMLAYRDDIVRLLGPDGPTPLMTVMLGPLTTEKDIEEAAAAGAIAFKLYPDGVTTGSEGGVRNIYSLWPLFKAMERHDLVLCLHGEMPGTYCIKREIAFLDVLVAILRDFPKLRVVLEHITTKEAVTFVREHARLGHRIAATITAHHLVRTLDDVIGSKVRVHEHCQPCPKGPEDRASLVEAATSGDPCFFFGSDTAPHDVLTKECAEGCAGAFTADAALGTLAEVFEAEGRLHRLNDFLSVFGARHYGLPPNQGTLTLVKKPRKVPRRLTRRGLTVIPWRAGETVSWQVEHLS